MFFYRNEIHIQAFGEIPPAKLMPGDSSSSTFHEIQEFTISNWQKQEFEIYKFPNSKNQKMENERLRFPKF